MSSINQDYLNYFHFIGRIIGLAIFHKQYLSIKFSLLIYKKLLNKPILFADMEFIDPEIYKNIKWLLYELKFIYNIYIYEFTIPHLYLNTCFLNFFFIIYYRENNGAENLGLNFTLNIKDSLGNYKTIELKPNGKNINVTDSNKNEYIK